MVSKLNSWHGNTAKERSCSVLCLLVSLLISAASPAWAGKYAYGEQFVRVGQSWGDSGPLQNLTPGDSRSPQEDGDYQRQVAALEEQGGPYADALAEPLAGLGRNYRLNGDMEEALRLYRRALHVVRVNDGLYSERQIPILRELLDVYRVSGQMQSLDERYDYYFRLYGRGRPPFTDIRLRAALGYLRWQREAVRLEIDDDDSRRLLALYQLNGEILQAVAVDPSVAWHWRRDLTLSQLRNLYLVEDRFSPGIETRGVAPETPLRPGEWSQQDFDKKRLVMIQRGALSRGTRMLQDLIAATTGTTERTELARLHLAQGDWYQWHGSDKLAGEQYQRVVQLLSQSGHQGLLQEWLGQPVELPDNGAFWQSRSAAEDDRQVVVSMRYDVSARGRASNLQAAVSDPKDEGLASRLKRKLAHIRFRPRWASGTPESVLQVQRDYQLID